MKIHILLFNWRGKFDEVFNKLVTFKTIKSELKDLNLSITVINSDEAHDARGGIDPDYAGFEWINIGEDSYFGAQFAKAVEVFDGDIMMHVQGDCSYDSWKKLIQDALRYHEVFDWGIYAPNVDYTWYTSENADIDFLNNRKMFWEGNLKWVSCTDCTCWFIDKEVIESYKALGFDMSKYKLGWGWDLILPTLSYLLEKPVIRDYNHKVDHPLSTNYNKDQGEREMAQMFIDLQEHNETLGRCVRMLKYDKEQWGAEVFWMLEDEFES